MATPRTAIRESRMQTRERIVAAATELARHRAYGALTVDEVMREAGFGRTIFYRHFDDLADLFLRAGRAAIDELFAAQRSLDSTRIDDGAEILRTVVERAVAVYERHGPVLRAIAEAAAGDEDIAAGQRAMRHRFDELLAGALRDSEGPAARLADVAETSRALNLLNESYLLEAFGHDPLVSAEVAVQTLTEIWVRVIQGHAAEAGAA